MSAIDLFQLLPAVYRVRDAQIASAQTLLTPAQQAQLTALLQMQAMQQTRDPHGTIRAHMLEHQKILAQQMQAQAEASMPKGAQGVPGGAGPGVAGSPKPGAQVQGPRPGMQQPNGAVRPDQMPTAMPRKM